MKVGLYQLLNTPNIQEKIKNLGKRAILEKASSETIARLFAQEVSKEIEHFVREKLENSRNSENDSFDDFFQCISDKEFPRILEDSRPVDDEILTEIRELDQSKRKPRPTLPIDTSDLIVPDGRSPELGKELQLELASADHVDWLVSFIKLRAINGFYEQLQEFCSKPNKDGSPRLRIATTTYIGATEPKAMERLLELPNTQIRVNYDSSKTRLHAKAYIFKRDTGFGSAYVGSANLSKPALTSGLEWTVKVSEKELPHLWQRIEAEFESAWLNEQFEDFGKEDLERFKKAIDEARGQTASGNVKTSYIHLAPHLYQKKMIDALCAEREQGKHRHLIVSATGTGKTMVAAFDYARMVGVRKQYPKLLYICHRVNILGQAREKYRAVLDFPSFGDLPSNGQISNMFQSFCSIQSWESHARKLGSDFYDVIVLDECHHAAANSYQAVLDFYADAINSGKTDLIGLTATPFRADGVDIRPSFGGCYTHELSLSLAIQNGHIVPFTYFGVDDKTDFTDVDWSKKSSAEKRVNEILTNSQVQLDNLLGNIRKHIADVDSMRAIGFCAGIEHAQKATAYMNGHGIPSAYLTGTSSQQQRQAVIAQIEAIPPKVNVIFVADLFNEGVDIPSVNTVFMLRPTNSPLVFIQQLGRGLRKAPEQYNKSDLLVLDFVGNHNGKYHGYLDRFRALSTRPDIPLVKQIEQGMPFVPASCSISLTQKSQARILNNIKEYLSSLKRKQLKKFLIEEVFAKQDNCSLTELMQRIYCESPAPIYQVGMPSMLAIEAKSKQEDPNSEKFGKAMNVLGQNDSPLLYGIWKKLLKGERTGATLAEEQLAKFFLLSIFDSNVRMQNAETAWKDFTKNSGILLDIIEFIEWRQQRILPMESKVYQELPLLEVHRTYTSKQISAALGYTGSVIMSGTQYQTERNVDIFFVTRIKDEKDFSPTTMYDDYLKAPDTLHWQSPSRTRENSKEGQRYIENTSKKMVFMRQQKRVQHDCTGHYPITGTTSDYVFLGAVTEVLNHHGEMPISFDYKLEHEVPSEVFEWGRAA